MNEGKVDKHIKEKIKPKLATQAAIKTNHKGTNISTHDSRPKSTAMEAESATTR